MNKTLFALAALGAMASSQAWAESHYSICFGGGRAALYWSGVFPIAAGTKTAETARAFNAFVKAKYGASILSECHSNATAASVVDDKKLREASDQTSKFPSKLVETGWMGK